MVVLLQGRYAGRKAVVVKTHDEGNGSRKFPHAVGKYRSGSTTFSHHLDHHPRINRRTDGECEAAVLVVVMLIVVDGDGGVPSYAGLRDDTLFGTFGT